MYMERGMPQTMKILAVWRVICTKRLTLYMQLSGDKCVPTDRSVAVWRETGTKGQKHQLYGDRLLPKERNINLAVFTTVSL